MKQTNTSAGRAVRIELLHARAALERQTLARNVNNVARSLRPSALIKGAIPGLLSARPSGWLLQGLGLMRRYPLLASSVSAVLSGAGKRHRLWRIGAGLLLSWQIARSMSGSKTDTD